MVFAFRLAAHLGMTVGELSERMSAQEFNLWWEYYRLEPFGEARADLRNGILCALLANIHASRGKSFKPKDFMPDFGPPKEITAADIKKKFEFGVRMHNAFVAAQEREACRK